LFYSIFGIKADDLILTTKIEEIKEQGDTNSLKSFNANYIHAGSFKTTYSSKVLRPCT